MLLDKKYHCDKKPQRLVKWTPPQQGWVKLNVDGSSFKNPKKSGFGGLIRASDGSWLLGFHGFLGCTSSFHAELAAIKYGLQIALLYGYDEIECETDSRDSIEHIKNSDCSNHRYGDLIEDIRSYLEEYSITLSHVLREANSCADFLAKEGATKGSGQIEIFEVPPSPSLEHLFMADFMGKTFVRM